MAAGRRADAAGGRLFAALVEAVQAAGSFDRAVEAALDTFCEVLGFPYGEAWLPPDGGGVRRLVPHPAWRGEPEGAAGFRAAAELVPAAPDADPAGDAWAEDAVVWLPDLGARGAWERAAEAAAAGFGACLAFPAGPPGSPAVVLAFYGPARTGAPCPGGGDLAPARAYLGAALRALRAEERLAYLSAHDPVTGLANRTALSEALERAVAAAQRGTPASVVFLDLDGFKLVNDTLGHAAGDELLRHVARRLRATLRGSDLLARFGGDEFVVLLPGTTPQQAAAVADRLRAAVAACQVGAGGRAVGLDASAGIVGVDGSLPPAAILSRADAAMYAAKQQGGSRTVVADGRDDPSGSLAVAGRWLARLRRALEEDGFAVHYQPIVAVETGAVHAHEALVRLLEPGGRPIPAGRFWAVAERFGLAPAIDRWVVRRVLADLAAHPALTAWVNLSGRTLGDEEALAAIGAAVRAAGPAAARLAFELTETAAITDLAGVAGWMAELRDLGVRFVLDDFGAGFASLRYLHALPLDVLKIDGSFVRGAGSDPRLRALMLAGRQLAESLGLACVAEQVEDAATADLLRDHRVPLGQGRYFGAPEPLDGAGEAAA